MENTPKPLFSMSIDEIVNDINKKDKDDDKVCIREKINNNLKIVALTSSIVFILLLFSPIAKDLCLRINNEYFNKTCIIPIILTLIFGVTVYILLNQLPS
jgi:ABC-type xylose transport system permease subunit